MDFEIIDVFGHDCNLCVCVDHFHADGSFWFRENYLWQGREGLKRKRRTDAGGRVLMDDGSAAPVTVDSLGHEEAYLPEGRDWARYDTPHMDESSVVDTIQNIHQRRLLTGWPQGTSDILSRIDPGKVTQQDRDGCSILVAKFAYLVGHDDR